MKIFIQSCHASLEYDQARMFLKMGHKVAGSFDVGSRQRPKIKNCTDRSQSIEDAYREADVFILHQVEDYSNVFDKHVHAMFPRPVILTYFGQGCSTQHEQVVSTLRDAKNAFVVCYSHKEEDMLVKLGVPLGKVKMIRFGKDLSEFRRHGGGQGGCLFVL